MCVYNFLVYEWFTTVYNYAHLLSFKSICYEFVKFTYYSLIENIISIYLSNFNLLLNEMIRYTYLCGIAVLNVMIKVVGLLYLQHK